MMVLISKSRMAQIFEIAAHQFHVVGTDDLKSIPVDSAFIYRKVRAGEMAPVLARTWVCGPAAARIGYEQICMAGVISSGPVSAISHTTAAVRHGLWRRDGRDEIHVLTTRNCRRTHGWPGQFHRTATLDTSEIVLVHGMPTTSVTRTIFDLGTRLTAHQIAHVLDEAAFLQSLDLSALTRLLMKFPRAKGGAVVRRAIELHLSGSAGSRSWSEDVYLAALVRAGIAEPVVNTRGTIPGFDHEPDFVFHAQRLIIEIDGPGHTKPGRLRLDAAADARLRAAGWRVVRFRAADVRRNPDRFARQTRRLLEQ